MKSLHQRLGTQAMMDKLGDLGTEDIPQHDPYEVESQSNNIFHILNKEPEVIQGWGDQYWNAKILLKKVARGLVVH